LLGVGVFRHPDQPVARAVLHSALPVLAELALPAAGLAEQRAGVERQQLVALRAPVLLACLAGPVEAGVALLVALAELAGLPADAALADLRHVVPLRPRARAWQRRACRRACGGGR